MINIERKVSAFLENLSNGLREPDFKIQLVSSDVELYGDFEKLEQVAKITKISRWFYEQDKYEEVRSLFDGYLKTTPMDHLYEDFFRGKVVPRRVLASVDNEIWEYWHKGIIGPNTMRVDIINDWAWLMQKSRVLEGFPNWTKRDNNRTVLALMWRKDSEDFNKENINLTSV